MIGKAEQRNFSYNSTIDVLKKNTVDKFALVDFEGFKCLFQTIVRLFAYKFNNWHARI